ncbi:hypothetical protein CDL12_21027 [Handroanthus impetiginosus]|uniref:Uncharacterized protein n=1 Tax=Handroanthus impetiginosus TaxID=429701 RepID=A0A2G9GMC1_9LAMI|nr:hypothetical protein CDL12_21027 [Handroanthus impetiginosus]
MDPPSIIKTFKYNSSQQPTFNVLETPLHYKSFAQINDSSFQDVSFSSYLKSKDSLQKSQENAIDDTEISIFDAQKYFSETSDPKDIKMQQKKETISHDVLSVPRISSVSSDGYGRNFRTRSFNATPTVSSEASWNSQAGLLVKPPGSMGVSLKNLNQSDHHNCKKRGSVARKWIFGRKCCCSGKNSVQVKEVTSDFEQGGPVSVTENSNNGKVNYSYTKRDSQKAKAPPSILEIHHPKVMAPNSPKNNFPVTDPPRQQRVSASGRPFGDGFSFPILNPSTKPPIKEIIAKTIINPVEDPPRDSLEVYQPMHDPPSVSRQHLSSIARVTNTDDDVGSDASSDLFEIESFSTQTTSYPMYRRRDSLDEAPTFNARRFAATNGLNIRRSLDEPPTPSIAATECYAPSEVSIDWSVTTAEGFDRASVSNFSISASEIGNAAFLRQRMAEEQAAASGGGKRKGNGGLLLISCRQEKAVSVGPQPVKYAPGEGPPVHVGGRPPRANKPPLGSDHSARLSLAFAA